MWDERENEVNRNQQIIFITNLTGLGLIIYWMFTQDFLKLENSSRYAKSIMEVRGCVLASTVAFTDTLLRVTMPNWCMEKNIRNMDSLHQSIERGICKKSLLKAGITMNSNEADTLAACGDSIEVPDQNDSLTSDNTGGTLHSLE